MNEIARDGARRVPPTMWSIRMVWHDLLFMHWPVPVEVLREKIPSGLEVDTFDGQAWLGVVPFGMRDVRHRWAPSMGPLSSFPELNLRTYVVKDHKPGVWFFSLDAASRLTVWGARARFHLPYFHARMKLQLEGDRVIYDSRRRHRNAPPAVFQGSYQPTGPVYHTRPGDLNHWLTARYCMYVANRRGRIARGDIDHVPWPLQPAEADVPINSIAEASGFQLPDIPPMLHFSREIVAKAWKLRWL